MATIMDGRAVPQWILDRCAIRVQEIVARSGRHPCLATVLVGDAPASVAYTRMKRTRSEAVGMRSLKVARDATVTICHARTHDLGAIVAEADLIFAAVGTVLFVQGSGSSQAWL